MITNITRGHVVVEFEDKTVTVEEEDSPHEQEELMPEVKRRLLDYLVAEFRWRGIKRYRRVAAGL